MCDKMCESRCGAVLIGAGMGNENMLTLDARTQIGPLTVNIPPAT